MPGEMPGSNVKAKVCSTTIYGRCERDRSGWEARWSRLLLPCRPSCRLTSHHGRKQSMPHFFNFSFSGFLFLEFVVELWSALRVEMIGCNVASGITYICTKALKQEGSCNVRTKFSLAILWLIGCSSDNSG